MSETEPISIIAGQKRPKEPGQSRSTKKAGPTTFNRVELDQILNLYCRRVASGEWRDYAIDLTRDRAVFSIFRRSCEIPLYRIEKNLKLARRQGAYSVVAATGLILKRGHDLKHVLRVLEGKPQLVEV